MEEKDLRDAGGFQYYIGGYETLSGRHYNVEAGDTPPRESRLPDVDYASVFVVADGDNMGDGFWIHVNGPFNNWDEIEEDIFDVLDAY